jgi:cytoskeletal protein CcmA (bactofilin family)
MWNKKEDPPRPYTPPATPQAPVAPSYAEPKKETTPVSSMPGGRFEPEARGSATIGKAVKIVGQIFSKEDLYVDGDVEGTVEALEHKLTIGPHGTVHATVKAREVVAQGTVQGNVEATDKIEIRKDAKLVGDIRTARIIIEDGAYFKGSIDIVKPEPAKNAPKPQQSAPAPAAAAAPKP